MDKLTTYCAKRDAKKKDKNSSGDEIANVNFFYDDIAHVGAYFKIPKKRTYFV